MATHSESRLQFPFCHLLFLYFKPLAPRIRGSLLIFFSSFTLSHNLTHPLPGPTFPSSLSFVIQATPWGTLLEPLRREKLAFKRPHLFKWEISSQIPYPKAPFPRVQQDESQGLSVPLMTVLQSQIPQEAEHLLCRGWWGDRSQGFLSGPVGTAWSWGWPNTGWSLDHILHLGPMVSGVPLGMWQAPLGQERRFQGKQAQNDGAVGVSIWV